MSRKLLVVAMAVITSGCATTVASDTAQLRGHYTWGHEVRTFRPCGSSQSFWVVGDAALIQPLQDLSASLAESRGKPYPPIYVEVSAIAQGKATDGFAAGHDGVYRFTSIQVINSQSPADCPADD